MIRRKHVTDRLLQPVGGATGDDIGASARNAARTRASVGLGAEAGAPGVAVRVAL